MTTESSVFGTITEDEQVARGVALGIVLWLVSSFLPGVNGSIAALSLVLGTVTAIHGERWYRDAGRELVIVGGTAILFHLVFEIVNVSALFESTGLAF